MLFNSIAFAVFLPIVFMLYWCLPHRYRWCLLLASSYYFYMSWNVKYVFLILFATMISYLAAIMIEKEDSKRKKKFIMIGAAVVCLGVLFYFKYFNFVSESIVNLLGLFTIKMNPVTIKVLLPVGISFYTFQTLGYVIDVYKGEVKAEKHFGYYATFISFFPQLVAGPIERTSNLLPQIKMQHEFNYGLAMYGARKMLWGFFKKIAVADMISIYVDKAYANLYGCTGFDLVLVIFLFTIQIYCDFSGYSDIAIGTAKLLGINLMENFKSPYFSVSIKEFWSRWHISLSTWFKDYIYIPLGGNRCSKIRSYVNLFITFIVSGIWHGANWTYVVWGGIHGIFQVIEKACKLDQKCKNRLIKLLRWMCVFIFCNITWVFFRAETLHDAVTLFTLLAVKIKDLSSFLHTSVGMNFKKLLYTFIVILMVAIYDYKSLSVDLIESMAKMNKVKRITVEYIILFIIVLALVKGTSQNQFVYFQF